MDKYLGLDIGGTSIKCGIILESGIIEKKDQVPTEAKRGGDYLIKKVISLIDELLAQEKGIKGIGISTAGQIDHNNGVVIYATDNLPGWTDMKIKERLKEKFFLPVYVDNDVNCAALGEKWLGVGKDQRDFLCLSIGTGIGGSIVINNQIYRGERGLAGEWGHMIVEKNGLLCTCGQRGCWEQYASTGALINYVKSSLTEELNVDGKYIFTQAASGNNLYQEAVERFIDYLGLGIANLTKIFNPSLVIVGGAITAQGEDFLAILKESISSHLMPSFSKNLDIKLAAHNNDAGILGAVYGLMIEEV